MTRSRRLLVVMTIIALSVLCTGWLFRAVYDRFPSYRYIPDFPENGQTVWRGENALPIPPLREFSDGRTDAEAYAAIATYYDENHESLALIFNETDDQRLRGLLAMTLTHIAVPYGSVPTPLADLASFVSAPRSHCGTFTQFSSQIGEALGLESRSILIEGGNHALTEFRIGDHWEVFDASFNLWIDTSIEAMMNGAPRRYRTFYSPMTDPAVMEVVDAYDQTWFRLRGDIPQWGIEIKNVAYEIT